MRSHLHRGFAFCAGSDRRRVLIEGLLVEAAGLLKAHADLASDGAVAFRRFGAQVGFQLFTNTDRKRGLLFRGGGHRITIRRNWYRTVMSSIVMTVHDLSILLMTKNAQGKSMLAQRLIEARSRKGWSQADLATFSGVAAAQISRYESARSVPRSEVAGKLAGALGVSFNWLLWGRELDEPSTSYELELELTPEEHDLLTKAAAALELDEEEAVKHFFNEAMQRFFDRRMARDIAAENAGWEAEEDRIAREERERDRRED